MTAPRYYGSVVRGKDGSIWAFTEMEPHVRLRFKQLFPGVRLSQEPPYIFPASPRIAADIEWFLHRYPMRMSAADAKALTKARRVYDQTVAELERFKMPDWQPGASAIGLKPGWDLCTHQARSIQMLKTRYSLLVGDEGGMGKTLTHTAFLAATPDAVPGAVVVDPHLQDQWVEKIRLYTDFRVHSVDKFKPYDVPEADVYVWRYSNIAGWADWFAERQLPSVGYDEIQALRTGCASDKGMAAKTLSKNALYRAGYSGTPSYNYAANEAWEVIQFLDDGLLGDRDSFLREWAECIGNDHYVFKDKKAFNGFLHEAGIYVRHRRDDLPPEDLKRIGGALPKPLPPLFQTVDYDTDRAKTLDDRARALAMRMTDRDTQWTERGQVAREFDMLARAATGVAKAASVAAFVKLLLDGGVDKLILWGWHRDVYDIWNAALADYKPVMHTGSETPKQKRASIQAFLKGDARILIMSLRSGAGVDGLQYGCNVGVFGELDWSPMVHLQCVWRIDRFGQTQPVQIYMCVTEDGSDPAVLEVQGIKRSEQHGAFEWRKSDDDDDMESVIVDRREEIKSRLQVLANHYLDGTGRTFEAQDIHASAINYAVGG